MYSEMFVAIMKFLAWIILLKVIPWCMGFIGGFTVAPFMLWLEVKSNRSKIAGFFHFIFKIIGYIVLLLLYGVLLGNVLIAGFNMVRTALLVIGLI